jgi:hypothetical protein
MTCAARAGERRSVRADSAVSQAKPVMMLARWNTPPGLPGVLAIVTSEA